MMQDLCEVPVGALTGLAGRNALPTAMALNTDASQDPENQWPGDSTEVALARYAANYDCPRPALEEPYPRLAGLFFDP